MKKCLQRRSYGNWPSRLTNLFLPLIGRCCCFFGWTLDGGSWHLSGVWQYPDLRITLGPVEWECASMRGTEKPKLTKGLADSCLPFHANSRAYYLQNQEESPPLNSYLFSFGDLCKLPKLNVQMKWLHLIKFPKNLSPLSSPPFSAKHMGKLGILHCKAWKTGS